MAQETIGTKNGQNYFVGSNSPAATLTRDPSTPPQAPPAGQPPVPPAPPAPAPAPDNGLSRVQGLTPTEQTSFSAAENKVIAPWDKNTAEQNSVATARSNAQAQIDAINKDFESQINTENKAGSEREAQTNALNAARGIMGGPDASAAMDGTKNDNAKAVAAIRDKQAATIAGVFAKVDQDAIAKADLDHQQAGAEASGQISTLNDILAKRKAMQGTAQDNFATVAKTAPLGWADFMAQDPERAQKFLDSTGYDNFYASMLWNQSKDGASQIQWNDKAIHYDTTRGVMVMVGYDPVAKKMVTQDFPVSGAQAASGQFLPKMFGKQLFLVPKNGIDPTKDLNGQMIPYGKTGQFSPTVKSSSSSGSSSDANYIAQAIVNGDQPPDLKGLYGKSADVRSILEQKFGFNLAKAQQDWTATQKYLSTLNGSQQVRLRQAVSFAYDSLDVVDGLNKEWQGGQFPLLNKASLTLALNGGLGKDAQVIATKLNSQISDLVSELATVYKGGNSSTDDGLQLAAKQLSADWSQEQLNAGIDLVRQNLKIRQNSINNAGVAGVSSDNPYMQPTDTSSSDPAAANQYAPGDVISVDGTEYTVGDDGQSLTPN